MIQTENDQRTEDYIVSKLTQIEIKMKNDQIKRAELENAITELNEIREQLEMKDNEKKQTILELNILNKNLEHDNEALDKRYNAASSQLNSNEMEIVTDKKIKQSSKYIKLKEKIKKLKYVNETQQRKIMEHIDQYYQC